ncbi:MAG: tail fiber protein [Bacteroidota bacterium]
MEPYLAEIRLFAGNFAPRNWAFCEGQILPINSYQSLYSLLGTTYGGDGRTSFALPDFRGRVPVSAGQSPGTSNYSAGQKVGQENNTLTTDQLPSHTHTAQGTYTPRANEEDGQSPSPKNKFMAKSKGTSAGDTFYATSLNAPVDMGEQHVNLTIGQTGASQPVNNMQPTIALNYIICLQGLFPSRN